MSLEDEDEDEDEDENEDEEARPGKSLFYLLRLLVPRVLSLFSPLSLLFLLSSLLGFLLPTWAAYRLYGWEAVEHGLLYHLGRKDHRHNYSIYWFSVYLGGDGGMATGEAGEQ